MNTSINATLYTAVYKCAFNLIHCKVAQDLGALFGTQSTDAHNRTHQSDHDHDHEHEHDHVHDHEHEHEHEHEHGHESTSETPSKVTPSPKGQKENATKQAKSKFVQVRKKSVDWSQYFGIDRRKKKATFMAGQGTQNQDDEWMLQRYYEVIYRNYYNFLLIIIFSKERDIRDLLYI